MPLEITHAELDVVIGVLVAAQALPVAVDEVMGHGEKRGGFIESKGSVGLGSVLSAGPGSAQHTDELLKQVRQFGFLIRLCSKLFWSHIK
jgi:hypothetical protein